MKKLATLILAAVAAVSFAAPASAAAQHARLRSCTSSSPECVYWDAYRWGFKAKWLSNVNSYYERGHAVCEFRSGGVKKTINGGWVTSTGLFSDAPCPGGFFLVKGGWQEKFSANGSITTHWEYP